MDLESQLLQDLLEFLRKLGGVKLPTEFEELRGRLLSRMQTALSAGSGYMEMQPGKPLSSRSSADDSSGDYVTPNSHPVSNSFLYQHQNKRADKIVAKRTDSNTSRPPSYLRMASDPSTPSSPTSTTSIDKSPSKKDEPSNEAEIADSQLTEYRNMTFSQAKQRACLFSQLQRRQRWLFFDNSRTLWAALVGSYVLFYDKATDLKPSQILCIKHCTCRAVDKTQPNLKKPESTFELCFADDKIFQFIAQSEESKEEWVKMITQKKYEVPKLKKAIPPPPQKQSRSVTPIPEAETSEDESELGETYDEVIHDITSRLAGLARPVEPSTSASLRRTPTKQKPEVLNITKVEADPPKVSRHINITNRVLPPPPSQEEDVYNEIVDHNSGCKTQTKPPSHDVAKNDEAIEDEYDVIDNVKSATKQTRDYVENGIEDSTETYDDVRAIQEEVENIRRNESQNLLMTENTKENKSPKKFSTPPNLPTKPSPVKNFFNKWTNRNESPPKETEKIKPAVSSPQKIPKDIKNNTDVHLNNTIKQEDISNYNTPPSPIPIQMGISPPHDTGYNEEDEPLYDDIGSRDDRFNNHIASPVKREVKQPERDENTTTKNISRPSQMRKIQSNVVRDLNKKFNAEIYSNEPENQKQTVDDSSEFYQVPKSDGNAKLVDSFKEDDHDDDGEQIYDDVQIVIQKKIEIGRVELKSVLKTPPKLKSDSPPIMVKPLDKKPFQKLNKFLASVAEKSPTEKNNQFRTNSIKKMNVQEVIAPMKKPDIMPVNDDIYDDCQAIKQ